MPTPKRNRPSGNRFEDVAVAWARIAGWMRVVGQVTAVVTVRLVVAAMPPITDHTKGDWPWRSIHGWKWSETHTDRKPAASARWARATSVRASCSSLDKAYASWGPEAAMTAAYPRPRDGNEAAVEADRPG